MYRAIYTKFNDHLKLYYALKAVMFILLIILLYLLTGYFCISMPATVSRPIDAFSDKSHHLWRSVCRSSQTNYLRRPINAIDQMELNETLRFFQSSCRSACSLSHDFGGTMVTSNISNSTYRGLDGQKAVCLYPPQLAPVPERCVVYSFGINDEWSFDEAMEEYGCQVFSFDPSMNISHHNRTDNIHFFRMGLGAQSKEEKTNQTDDQLVETKTLAQIYNQLKEWHGQVVIDYLKMDIEWAEWLVLPDIFKSGMLDKVRQMAVEIHLPFQPPHFLDGQGMDQFRRLVKIICMIENYGMVRFDSKRNLFFQQSIPSLNFTGPMAYEMAWYNNRFL